MASSFGVQLKKAGDGSKPGGSEGIRTPGGARRSDFKTKPVSDLKAMFDKKDDDPDAKVSTTTTTASVTKSQNQKKETTTTNKFGLTKKSSAESKTSTNFTKSKSDLADDDKEAFKLLKDKLNKTGINDLTEEKPKVAVAKTFSGGTAYKATVGGKEKQTVNSNTGPVSKGEAVSALSFGLTKLRTRPNSAKLDEDKVDEITKRPGSPRTPTKRPESPKFIPGAAKGWKNNNGQTDNKSTSSLTKTGNFSSSSIGKLKDEAKTEQKLALKGFRSVSPVGYNSDDSSSSSNLSPRGYKPSGQVKNDKSESVTDVNENIKKFENSSANTNVFNKVKKDNQSKPVNSALDPKRKTDPKSKLTTGQQYNVSKDKSKLNQQSGSASSDSERGKRSPRGKFSTDNTDKSKTSFEEFKKQIDSKEKTHRPLSRASSSGSNSSVSLSESRGLKSKIDQFGSPDSGNKTESKLGVELRRKEFAASRKMSTDKFLDIKKGFENKHAEVGRSESPSVERKAKLDIKSSPRILERKQSFEGGEIFRRKSSEKKDLALPKGSGNVLKHIQALHELDAKAKAQPSLVRRTRSLPSTSEPVNDDSSDYLYEDIEYHDAISAKTTDDISNEGDISSEADLYEVIPAHKGLDKLDTRKENNQRRATAFRKRRKTSEEVVKSSDHQPGTEGDIDSDSDSSNSGIYEQLDRDEDELEGLSESDNIKDSVPEPPSLKSISAKRKNKKAGDKVGKGFKGKFKQLYNKSKNQDYENTNKTNNGTGQQSSGLMSSLGDKLRKNLKKNKSSSAPNLEDFNIEDNPVCDSDGTDTDFDQEIGRRMSAQEDGSSEGQGPPQPPLPPPLPPRQSGLLRASSGGDIKLNNSMELPSRTSATNLEVIDNTKSGGTQQDTKTDPPLPPRNRISNNLDLNIVIPVKPGGDSRKPAKDSYLQGQKMSNMTKSPDDIPYIDMQSPSSVSSPDTGPALPQRPPPTSRKNPTFSTSSTDSYVDVGDSEIAPPLPQRPPKSPLLSQSSYVDVGDVPMPDSNYSLADEIRRDLPGRKELEKRPESSAYIKSTDLSTVPAPRSVKPVSDAYSFYNQSEEDGLYIDLSDDQVYGTIGSRYKSQLESESLYQVYNQEKIGRASKRRAIYSSFDESDEEGYYDDAGDKDSVYEDLSSYSSGRGSMDLDKKQEDEKANKMSTLELFGKKGTVLRALWAEMPEVKKSGVLDTIDPHERKLQESMFEIITSEATYLKSINVLIDVFLMSEEFGSDMSNKCVITKQERHVIFSNIGAIRDTSERFLSALESRWKESVVLSDVCDIIAAQASKYFECYVHYCSNQAFQDRAVTDLRKKQDFSEALRHLESRPECQGLPMISFLLLPMQRITRLPLLVDAICHRMDPIKDKDRHKSATKAFSAISKVVKKCNDGAKKMQQTEQMYHIAKQIDFASKEIASIPLISASRFLVKQGEVTRIVNDASSRLPFGKQKAGKQSVHLYLFNDLLLITKKRGDRFTVTDYGQRNTLEAVNIDSPEKHARVLPLGAPSGCKNLFLLVMLENHEKKQVETVFACNSTSDRARWVDAVTPVKVTEDDQRIYEAWDCPQVQCVKQYVAQEPDELSLEESDVVNVFKKIEDGMWEGERLRDGERGWFPKDHTIEIVNSHVRARNLKMKYRLMAAAGQ